MSVNRSDKTMKDREIVVERLVNAPRDLVFKVWSDPAHISRWWGPNGFTTTTAKMDFKPGGQWRFVMHGPDGRDYKNLIVYTDISPPARICYNHSDDGGGKIAFETTVTFAEQGSGTLVTLRTLFPSKEERDYVVREHGAVEGGKQTLARLANLTESMMSQLTPFTISRTFDAPRDLVWRVHTEPEHLQRWWGPKGCKLGVHRLEFRPGGMFHYSMTYSTGAAMWGRFFYREVDAPTRMVYLSSFATEQGGIARAPFGPLPFELQNTVTLTEKDGKTTLSIESVPFGTAAPEEIAFFDQLRDTKSLEQGFGGTLDQLEAYLKEQATAA